MGARFRRKFDFADGLRGALCARKAALAAVDAIEGADHMFERSIARGSRHALQEPRGLK